MSRRRSPSAEDATTGAHDHYPEHDQGEPADRTDRLIDALRLRRRDDRAQRQRANDVLQGVAVISES